MPAGAGGSVMGIDQIRVGTGVPTVSARPGTIWLRQDGGAGSSLYVQEGAFPGTVWQAVRTASGTIPASSVTAGTFGAGDFTFPGRLLLSTAASKIVPGATSLSLRNNADNADNILISDAGV